MKSRMQDFKLYLESKEIEMSKTTEYLAYYALPYIQNPRVNLYGIILGTSYL